tara:strand:- start:2244 stop:2666 length:423 start_codon:yes stop_codon:yes gene_type:complete
LSPGGERFSRKGNLSFENLSRFSPQIGSAFTRSVERRRSLLAFHAREVVSGRLWFAVDGAADGADECEEGGTTTLGEANARGASSSRGGRVPFGEEAAFKTVEITIGVHARRSRCGAARGGGTKEQQRETTTNFFRRNRR